MKTSEKLYSQLAELQAQTLAELNHILNGFPEMQTKNLLLNNDFEDDSSNRITGFVKNGISYEVSTFDYNYGLEELSLGDAIFIISELEAGLYEFEEPETIAN